MFYYYSIPDFVNLSESQDGLYYSLPDLIRPSESRDRVMRVFYYYSLPDLIGSFKENDEVVEILYDTSPWPMQDQDKFLYYTPSKNKWLSYIFPTFFTHVVGSISFYALLNLVGSYYSLKIEFFLISP